MAKYLIDTDIWIDFLKKKEYAVSLIQQLSEYEEVFASVLTVTELRAGMDDDQSVKYMPLFYSLADTLGVSSEVAEQAGKFLKEYSTKGISLGTVDTIIASSAISEGCNLVTNNKKDYPMPEIKFYPAEQYLENLK